MPANFFQPFLKKSQRTGWRGTVYRFTEKIGAVTRSSPIRRTIQVVVLLLFLLFFFYTCWPYSDQFGTNTFADKEFFPVESILLIDPLVGISTALAGRWFNWPTFFWTLGILSFCILIPRAFCGYFCPLGTLIDAFDWLIGRHFKKFHLPDNGSKGGWVHLKYYALFAILISSVFGLLISGFFSAIPVLTRGLLFTGGRAQIAVVKGGNHLGPVDWTFYLSIALFAGVFLVGILGRRFWCRYLCPSGALLSVFNFLRVGERKVEESCINCNKCVEICPFDAIHEDYTTRVSDCTYCQSCGGVCPTHSIKFVDRWNNASLKAIGDTDVVERPLSRRGFFAAGGVGCSVALLGATDTKAGPNPLRPPGSVPEAEFLDLCIRCGECFKVCPGPVLHPAGLEHGFEGLWTPIAKPEHAGCHQDCNFCTDVCPTGAIQPLPIEVKRANHMGLAKVNEKTCLPFREDGREDCDLCFQECVQAGYDAIEMREIEIQLDAEAMEAEGYTLDEIEAASRINAPFVDPDLCVGCGICTYRCHTKYVKQDQRLEESAIVVYAENQHRLMNFPDQPAELPPPK
jgi:polyferredoxin